MLVVVKSTLVVVGVMAAPLVFVLRSELGVNGVGGDGKIVGDDLIETVSVCVVVVVRSDVGVSSLPDGTLISESENGNIEAVGFEGGVLRVRDTLVVGSTGPSDSIIRGSNSCLYSEEYISIIDEMSMHCYFSYNLLER
jgi:hypothetical protein